MELYISISAVGFLVLLMVNFYLFAKVENLRKKIKDVNSKMITMSGNIEFMKGVELDFSVLEDKCKDEIEQIQIQVENIFNKVNEEIENQSNDIEELELKVEELSQVSK